MSDSHDEALRLIDNFLASINFKIVIELDYISIEVTGNKEQDKYGNKKLIDFGCENQIYEIEKNGLIINLKVCGWRIGLHDRLHEVTTFILKSMK
jgi:hypothetical protein